MYDTYIYASYIVTFGPLAVLIGMSFRNLRAARSHLSALDGAAGQD